MRFDETGYKKGEWIILDETKFTWEEMYEKDPQGRRFKRKFYARHIDGAIETLCDTGGRCVQNVLFSGDDEGSWIEIEDYRKASSIEIKQAKMKKMFG